MRAPGTTQQAAMQSSLRISGRAVLDTGSPEWLTHFADMAEALWGPAKAYTLGVRLWQAYCRRR